MQELMKQLRETWAGLARPQKLTVAGLTALVLGGLLASIFLGGNPDYVPIAYDLEQAEAQRIAAKLTEAEIPYRSLDGGSVIQVDADRLQDARKILLKEGLGGNGSPGEGYASLADIGLSMTDDQRKAWMRVLQEQELARTIRNYNQNVRKAKVHITPAVRRSFRRGDEPAKAVVTIANEPGTWLDSGQVQAIQVLVANAVAGLDPDHVAVIDSSGRNLARDPALAGIGDAWSVSKVRREQELQRKLGSALADVLGSDDVRVRVSLELDRERIEKTDKSIDTGSKALVREKIESSQNTSLRPGGVNSTTAEQTSKGGSGGSGGSKTEKIESDFDYSTQVSRLVKEPGAIKRMSVAVFVNHDPNDPELNREPLRRTLEEVARATVGIDPSRGDTFALSLIPFRGVPAEEPPPEPGFMDDPRLMEWVQWGVAALLSLGVALYLLRSAKKARAGLREALREPTPEEIAEAQAQRQQQKPPVDPREEIVEVIDQNPEAVGRLLRNWIYETAK